MKDKNQKVSRVGQKKPSKKEIMAEVNRQRGIVKDIIYPIILKHATSVKNAQNMCKTIVVGMDAIFMQDVKAYTERRSREKLSTLDLLKFMSDKSQYAGERELITALQNEMIGDAKGFVEGMQKELERLVDKEMVQKPISELKTEFL